MVLCKTFICQLILTDCEYYLSSKVISIHFLCKQFLSLYKCSLFSINSHDFFNEKDFIGMEACLVLIPIHE